MPGIYGIKGDLTKVEDFHQTMLFNGRYKANYTKPNQNTALGISYYKNESYEIFKNEKYVIGLEGYFYTKNSKVSNSVNKLYNLFLEYDRRFVEQIDGIFNIFIYDKSKDKLSIFNDWAGNSYLFYYWDNHNFIFSSEMKAILNIIENKNLNMKGITQQFLFDHCLYDNTLVNEIKVLSPGSILEFQKNQLNINQYFDITNHLNPKETKSKNEYIEELYSLFEDVTQKFVHIDNISLPMTGGLDSRLLFHFLGKFDYNFQDIFTMGQKDDEDVIISKSICDHYNLPHRRFERTFQDLRASFEEGYRYHDGELSSIFNHIEKQKQIVANNCYSIIQYFYNDIVFGEKFAFQNNFLKNSQLNRDIIFKIINIFVQKDRNIIAKLFQNQEMIDSTLEEIYEDLNSVNGLPTHSVFDYFGWTQHCRRWVNIGNSSARSTRYIRRLVPSQDKNIIFFAFNLPYKYRKWRYLYRKMIEKKCPELSTFPREGTGIAMYRNNFFQILARAYQKYFKTLFSKSNKIQNFITFYKDIVNDKIVDLLFSTNNRTDELVYPKYKKKIWENIKKGKNQTNFLHNIINLEIFLREHF